MDQLTGQHRDSVVRHLGSMKRWSWRPPSVPTVVFILLSVLVPLVLQKPLLNSDGDLARHLRHGQYMLDHGELIRADPFSFTRPGADFIGFEYGSQLIYALAERCGGLPAVAVLAGILVALTYALLAAFLLRRGVEPLLACLAVALAIVLGIEHWMARPHLFSFLAVVLLLGLLERPSRKSVLWCAVLFAIWANLHGGFVYGWILITLYLVGSLGELVWDTNRDAWRQRAGHFAGLLITAVGATLFNPHGFDLHRHILEFFSMPFLRDHTAEFASPDFHEPGAQVFLLILLLTLITPSVYGRRPTLPRLLVISVGAAFALISVRNIPLFGLTALPLLALHVDEGWRRLPDRRGLRHRFGITAGTGSMMPWALPVFLLLCGLAISRGKVGSLRLLQDEFDASVFPVNAVAHARAAGLQGRLFAGLAWGGYVLYAWPEQRVFIDGGTDFYGEELFREYLEINSLAPGWRHALQRWEISLMLIRRQSALAHQIVRESGWGLWYCDSLAVVVRRGPGKPVVTSEGADSLEQQLVECGRRTQVRRAKVPGEEPDTLPTANEP